MTKPPIAVASSHSHVVNDRRRFRRLLPPLRAAIARRRYDAQDRIKRDAK